ncbi:peroxide stress protein YaaA [Noviherbaspirillum sp. UKPF54]|uniref:peroxide stress protein YaaA n=1 Tax=Noviherbaspirillum sp. UKPF54 TaxID=2601898 RepID=UPI0011B16BE7|nr:peroxide stress protein YaaA [Noviherbaspirillum sp. UKPF54]QDZ29563.1 peroxide stress protein YaaA [Noviherbaspirillum sp. UKPF54]
MKKRIALVSCVKSKRQHAVAAAEMYTSPLFAGMRRYAERHTDAWYILSAEFGLLRPDTVISPYERTLNTMLKHERAIWAERVKQQLNDVLSAEASVVVLAGKRYRESLIPFLESKQLSVEVPMHGLSFGRQLRWLKEH